MLNDSVLLRLCVHVCEDIGAIDKLLLFLRYGLHACIQYSICGLIIVLLRVTISCFCLYVKGSQTGVGVSPWVRERLSRGARMFG